MRLNHLKAIGTFSSKKIYKQQQCKQIIAKTSSTIEKVAQITLGPYGRNVLIQSNVQSPRITKDGITVVKHIQFENRLEDAVATLIKKSVDGTNKYAGDGTTTSTILIGQIMRLAYKKISTGANTRDIRKGFQIGRSLCLQFLDSCSRKITTKQQLFNVAMISTNGKTKIAEIIVEALFNSSKVKVQKSQKTENSIEYRSGLTIPQGLSIKQFNNHKSSKLIFNYPLVVTSLVPINLVKDTIKILQLAKKSRKQLIIFAPQLSEAVKSTLIYNNIKKVVQCACIQIPHYSQNSKYFIQKISKQAQSYLFREFSDIKIQNIDWKHFGKAVKIEADSFETKIQTINEGSNQNIQAVIFVGGSNQTAMLQNYDHMIDALNSSKSAMKDGVVAGGGVTFWRLSQLLQNYTGQGQDGVKVLSQALKQPRLKLMQYILSENNPLGGENWSGYNIKQQKIMDMFQAGIVDSVNVAKSTIIDSLSLCTVLVQVAIGLAREDRNISTISLKQLSSKYQM